MLPIMLVSSSESTTQDFETSLKGLSIVARMEEQKGDKLGRL